MRKVIVSRYVQPPPVNGVAQKWALTEQGQAMFHQFGVNYEEFENGPGNYSTAIVEWPNGEVESVRAEHVRFVDAV